MPGQQAASPEASMETVHCNEYLKFFLALLAIVNPVGILPIFINMTASQDRVARNRNGTLAAVSMGIILLVVLVSGEALLRFFSISVDSFRVGGGILVLLMAISMLNARVSNVRQTREEELWTPPSGTVSPWCRWAVSAPAYQLTSVRIAATNLLLKPAAALAYAFFHNQGGEDEKTVVPCDRVGSSAGIRRPCRRYRQDWADGTDDRFLGQ